MKNKIKDFYYSNATRSEAELSKGGSEARLSKSHSHLQASPRKTFKKLYEQKHLVRNTKDQYSAVCDKVWQKSHQRLKIQLDGAMSNSIPLTECSTQSEGTKSKTAFGKSTTFDFFDLYPVKKTPSSNNRYMLLGSASMLPLGSAAAPVPPKSKTTFGKGGSVSLTSSIVVKWKRKNTAKLSNVGSWNALEGQVEGRTVVNIASDKYYKRIKIKTLKEMIG